VKRSIKKNFQKVPARIEWGLFFGAYRCAMISIWGGGAHRTRICHSGSPSGVKHLPLVLPEG
jgi:hypothetical protein